MIHVAGEMTSEGVQRCERCGAILTDYRGAMVPDGQGPLGGGWAVGAHVEVLTGNPKYSGLTDDAADCEQLQ
jgi:hypothetical protein